MSAQLPTHGEMPSRPRATAVPIQRSPRPEQPQPTPSRAASADEKVPQVSASHIPGDAAGLTLPAGIPVEVTRDRTLRVKIIDACGLTCTFCHNEGTPVASDNLTRSAAELTGAGHSGRVSIYLASNGARFLPATVRPDEEFEHALGMLRDALEVDELHLTGGEPSLHPRLAEVIAAGRSQGYTVCMTSNGENAARALPAAAAAGLDRVNFSIFGTTPAELAQVQAAKYANPKRAVTKIQSLKDGIAACADLGVRASANIVVPGHSHTARVHRILDEWAPTISVRLLNSLDDGAASIEAIHTVLADRGAVIRARHVTAGVSGFRDAYQLPDGRTVYFKQIRRARLPQTCAGCRFNNDRDCHEGYYGVRLYRDRAGGFQVGVCIQRMDLCLPLGKFVTSRLRDEVVALRETEHARLLDAAATQ